MRREIDRESGCKAVRIAILDWDGTLRPGWTLPDWIDFLVRTQVLDQEATVRIAPPFDHYAAGNIDHDRLAFEATHFSLKR
jgi:hypothetical protein